MFIEAIIFSVIIGYVLKGRLKNIDIMSIKAIYLVLAGFLIKFIIVISIRHGFLTRGVLTYILYVIQYSLLLIFVIINRKNKYILIMGIGFLLNAVPIFTNGGAMPVSIPAAQSIGLTKQVWTVGLYRAIDGTTRFNFLGDIIPFKLGIAYVFSIGDIVLAVGLFLFIVTGMKKKESK
ncbi:MAG: DUF5317 domain-containing protein [Bacillota bacterium]|nr:DUF5317 domain-containing protein [Bacillota bacterium]